MTSDSVWRERLQLELRELCVFRPETDLEQKKVEIEKYRTHLLEPLKKLSEFLQFPDSINPLTYPTFIVGDAIRTSERIYSGYKRQQEREIEQREKEEGFKTFDSLKPLLEKLKKDVQQGKKLTQTEKQILSLFNKEIVEEVEKEKDEVKSEYAQLFDRMLTEDMPQKLQDILSECKFDVQPLVDDVKELYECLPEEVRNIAKSVDSVQDVIDTVKDTIKGAASTAFKEAIREKSVLEDLYEMIIKDVI